MLERVDRKNNLGKNKSLSTYKGWHWDKNWGKNAIYNLEKDSVYQKFEINTYSGSFSDYFYLPKNLKCKNLCLDVSFICLSFDFIRKFEDLFKKYQII